MGRAGRRQNRQSEGGPLAGIPLGIKDLFGDQGRAHHGVSKILGNFVPPYESTVPSQLWRDGAVMLGKRNNDEFAMGCRRNLVLRPGGQSVAAKVPIPSWCRAALRRIGIRRGGAALHGRDRDRYRRLDPQPAAFTATVGVKPTYGRCSRWGIVAFASSLDQAGPIARTTRDAAILMRSMAGHDPKDTTSVNVDVPDYEAAIGKSVKGMKIGIPKEYRLDGMPAEIEKLWSEGAAWLKAAGAETGRCVRCRTPIRAAGLLHRGAGGASSNLARYDGVRYGLRVPGRSIGELYEKHPRRGLWRRSPPPRHDRHYVLSRATTTLIICARKKSAPDQEGF